MKIRSERSAEEATILENFNFSYSLRALLIYELVDGEANRFVQKSWFISIHLHVPKQSIYRFIVRKVPTAFPFHFIQFDFSSVALQLPRSIISVWTRDKERLSHTQQKREIHYAMANVLSWSCRK